MDNFNSSSSGNKNESNHPEISQQLIIIGGVLLGLFFVLMLWALLAPIDSVAISRGTIVVASKNKLIQHPEGGAIKKSYVETNDLVDIGDPLILLSNPETVSLLNTLDKERLFLLTKKARLEAFLEGSKTVVFPQELIKRASEPDLASLIKMQQDILRETIDSYAAKLKILESRAAQINEKRRQTTALYDAVESQLRFLESELEAVHYLLEKQLVRKPRMLALEREKARLLGESEKYQTELLRLDQEIAENEGEKSKLIKELNERALTELEEQEEQLLQVEPRLQAAREKVDRLMIRSPAKGIIKGLRYKTIGEVIGAGEPVMEIVPDTDLLVVEAEVEPNDIDMVFPGLKAKVIVSALSYRYSPSFFGVVESVSPDAFVRNEEQGRYYTARVSQFDEQWKEIRDKLSPGMQVEVMIINDRRTVFYYIFSPIYDSFNRAFKES